MRDDSVERLRAAVDASATVRGRFIGLHVALHSTIPVQMLGLTVDPPGRPVLRGTIGDPFDDLTLTGHVDTPTLDPKVVLVLGALAGFTFGVSPVLQLIANGRYDPTNLALLLASAAFLAAIVWIFRVRSFVTRDDRAAIITFLDGAGIRFVDTAATSNEP